MQIPGEQIEAFWGEMIRLAPPGGIKDSIFRLECGKWKITANGFREKREGIGPFSVFVEYNGLPAGIIDPFGACMVHGSKANLGLLVEELLEMEHAD